MTQLRSVTLARWDHTVLPATRHKWTHPAFTPARQAGTRFTNHLRVEGWVSPGPGCKSNWPIVVTRQPRASEARTHDLGITSPARWPLGYRVTTMLFKHCNALITVYHCYSLWWRQQSSSMTQISDRELWVNYNSQVAYLTDNRSLTEKMMLMKCWLCIKTATLVCLL